MNGRFTETEQAIAAELHESIEAKQATLDRELSVLARIAETVVDALAAGGKVLIFGNGGSAADSQHIAAGLGWKPGHPFRQRLAVQGNQFGTVVVERVHRLLHQHGAPAAGDQPDFTDK